jgi:hypothetical protein
VTEVEFTFYLLVLLDRSDFTELEYCDEKYSHLNSFRFSELVNLLIRSMSP